MKTGHLMVIGLVASIWSGTGDYDDLTFTTVWEDSKHGGNMQASLLFMNLHSKCVQTNSVPESIIISADNTVKETKNGIFFCFMVWLLAALQHTRLWRVRTSYKLVGHTHSHCDRAFSRVRAALLGKTYMSEPVTWLDTHTCMSHAVLRLYSGGVGLNLAATRTWQKSSWNLCSHTPFAGIICQRL